jgi:UDPglucose 6-dehydrogenase
MVRESLPKKIKICIVGAGYVGLVSAVCFAEIGHEVVGVDKDKEKIEKLKKGVSPIFENKLEPLLKKNLKKGRIYFTTDLKEGLKNSLLLFNAVGTPPGEQRKVDLRYVWEVAKEVGKILDHYIVFVNKSTVPPGTTEKVEKIIQKNLKKKINFDVASNPEFLREGSAIKDFLEPNRIVIGVKSKKAEKILKKVYKPIIKKGYPLIVTDIKSSEMIKYVSNAFLATKLSFINEIANLCEKIGVDVKEVIKGLELDERMGKGYFNPGPGFGGSCLPKDIDGLINFALDHEIKLKVLDAVRDVNEFQRKIAILKLKKYLPELFGKTIAIWGLAFKANTDDIRESPAIEVIKKLIEEGAKVKCYDPLAIENAKKILNHPSIEFYKNKIETLKNTDALILMTDWEEFKKVKPKEIKKYTKIVIDTRNIWDKEKFKKVGLTYEGIGI